MITLEKSEAELKSFHQEKILIGPVVSKVSGLQVIRHVSTKVVIGK